MKPSYFLRLTFGGGGSMTIVIRACIMLHTQTQSTNLNNQFLFSRTTFFVDIYNA